MLDSTCLLRCANLSGAKVFLRALALLAGLSNAIAALPVIAQEDTLSRVGRLADVAGQVFYSPENDPGEWQAIGLNYPIAGGANLWVSTDGHAEVDFGGSQLRLAGDANVHLARLDGGELVLFVAQGAAIVRLRVLEPGDSAIVDTPNAQVALRRVGLYRIDVSPDREHTTVIVREGEAEVEIGSGSQSMLPGQKAEVRGSRPTEVEVRNGSGIDGFDAWSVARDRSYEQAREPQYVSPQMVGAAELARYGSWDSAPEYGPIWFPGSVSGEWAPYSDGYWTSLPTFGWTWVDAAPWGYAPFHYGRWVSWNGRWGWCPGNYVSRPAWAPALVAWYGGPGFGTSVSGVGAVYGWVPLAWREAYVPAWRHCDSRCYARYNRPYAVTPIERNRVVPTTYANARVPGAITAVGGAAFAASRPIAVNRLPVPPAALVSAPVLAAAPQVKPAPATAGVPRLGVVAVAPASSPDPRQPRSAPLAPLPWQETPPATSSRSGASVARPTSAPPAGVPGTDATHPATGVLPRTVAAGPSAPMPVANSVPVPMAAAPTRSPPGVVAAPASTPGVRAPTATYLPQASSGNGIAVAPAPRVVSAPPPVDGSATRATVPGSPVAPPPQPMPPALHPVAPGASAIVMLPAPYAPVPSASPPARSEPETPRHPQPVPKAAAN